MSDLNYKTCYLCASDRIVEQADVNGFSVYKCLNCCLIWVNGCIDPAVIEKFYNSSYFNSKEKTGYKDYLAEENNHRRNSKNLIYEIQKYLLPGRLSRVIDIGCAYGFFLDEARKHWNAEVFGTEFSAEASEYARDKLKLNVNRAAFSSSHYEKSFFDVACMLGTVEHLISPLNNLREANAVIKPGGLLVMNTVDTQGWLPFYSIKPPEHLFYLGRKNIRLLLSKAGFEALCIKTYFVNYSLVDLMYRMSEFVSNAMLRALFSFAAKWVPDFTLLIPTNEMLVIAKKVECAGQNPVLSAKNQ